MGRSGRTKKRLTEGSREYLPSPTAGNGNPYQRAGDLKPWDTK